MSDKKMIHKTLHDRAGHGGDVFAAARDLGRHWKDILDYSANINPLGPPPGLKRRLFESFGLVQHYPDPLAAGWRRELAKRLDLDASEILAGNGTTALMFLIARELRPRQPLIVAPAFAEYEASLAPLGLKPGYISCRARDGFDLTSDGVRRIFDARPDFIYLANPSSPAGRVIQPEVMDDILRRSGRAGTTVVLDEAFIDFTNEPSLAGRIRDFRNLIVLKSMTKFYALPGLRLGYLTGSSRTVRILLNRLEPWSVNALALEAGVFCLDRAEYAHRTRKLVRRERQWLTGRLTALGMQVVPGEANYLLCRVGSGPAAEKCLQESMARRGILIRGCSSFQGILKGYIRLAVKNRASNRIMVEAMAETYEELRRLKEEE